MRGVRRRSNAVGQSGEEEEEEEEEGRGDGEEASRRDSSQQAASRHELQHALSPNAEDNGVPLFSHEGEVNALSADGLYLVSGGEDGCIKVWR